MGTLIAEHCMVCGQPLLYQEKAVELVCAECGTTEASAIHCPAMHYVCNLCHSKVTLAKLPELARSVRGQAPEDILENLLSCAELPMHGPEHHAFVGLAILEACRRAMIKLPDDFPREMIRRSLQVPGGACGYLGACGGAVSLGIAVSLVTGATPIKGLARGLANRATAMALTACGDDNARCCKRALRRSVTAGRKFFAEELGIAFPEPLRTQQCHDMGRNQECAGEHCPYFRHRSRASRPS